MSKKLKFLTALLAIVPITISSLVVAAPAQAVGCDYSAARSATQNGEVFLGGRYLELGISVLGDFGTEANGPTCFVARTGGGVGIGMATDVDGFGIGDNFPKGRQVDYVLSVFDKEEQPFLPELIDKAILMIESFIAIGAELTMTKFN